MVTELLRRDIIADLAPRNAPGIEVLATTGPISVNVRVKTKSEDSKSWVSIADKKDGSIFKRLHHERDFTVLIHLPASGPPQYWIVPTHMLDKEVRRVHDEWFARPARTGKPKSPENRMRGFGWSPTHWKWLEPYTKNWHLVLATLGAEDKGPWAKSGPD